MALTALRYICMITIYAAFTAVMYSVFKFEEPDGTKNTPPISPTMQCVINLNLTIQFFFTSLMLWIFITCSKTSAGGEGHRDVRPDARDTLRDEKAPLSRRWSSA